MKPISTAIEPGLARLTTGARAGAESLDGTDRAPRLPGQPVSRAGDRSRSTHPVRSFSPFVPRDRGLSLRVRLRLRLRRGGSTAPGVVLAPFWPRRSGGPSSGNGGERAEPAPAGGECVRRRQGTQGRQGHRPHDSPKSATSPKASQRSATPKSQTDLDGARSDGCCSPAR